MFCLQGKGKTVIAGTTTTLQVAAILVVMTPKILELAT